MRYIKVMINCQCVEGVLFHKSIRVAVMHCCEVGHHQARAFSSPALSQDKTYKTGEASHIVGAKRLPFI